MSHNSYSVAQIGKLMAVKLQFTYCSQNIYVYTVFLGLASLVCCEDSFNISCPPWHFYNNSTGHCQCYRNDLLNDSIHCTDSQTLVGLGNCMTYVENEGTIFAECVYYQLSNKSKIRGRYLLLPSNITELNDYMCGPMNRKGNVCSECVDGFGPSPTSSGFICANCSSTFAGAVFYILVEFVPNTIFYLIVLIFRINMTSAPMTGFIFYSQLVVYAMFKDPFILNEIIAANKKIVYDLMIAVGSLYGIWNLEPIKYALPPLCISSKISIIHIEFLNCVSTLYPLLLIILTLLCVELHGNNFRPIVLLWKPFHRYFVQLRRGYGAKQDIIDVFATFLLLTYSKLMYHSTTILFSQHIIKNGHSDKMVNFYDTNVTYMSKEHLPFVIVSILILIVFVIPPPFILLFYPTKAFQTCLAKCKLRKLEMILHTFVEKYYGCYKDGLNGGYDMRSVSALYFFLRPVTVVFFLMFTQNLFQKVWMVPTIFFVCCSILMAFIKPYKKTYMNLLDSLLFSLISALIMFGAVVTNYSLLIRAFLFIVPMCAFILFLTAIIIKKMMFKIKNCVHHYQLRGDETRQPLLPPTANNGDP